MKYPESDSSNLVIYSGTNRKPVEISKDRRNVAKARFLGNDPSKCVLNKLQASQIRDRCASKERVTVVESQTHYRRSICLESRIDEGRSNVTEYTNVKVRCLACFRNLFVERQDKHPNFWLMIGAWWVNRQLKWIWWIQPRLREFWTLGWKKQWLRLGWIEVKTIVLKPVVDPLGARL